MRLLFLTVSTLPSLALADTVQIPGPQGSLEAEMIAVEGAAHAVVIIPGSGPTDRDGNSAAMELASDTYKLLAEALAANGVASLRIDKRGMFGSVTAIPNPNAVTIADYADDARHWVEHASRLAPCIWIAGHSEGGLVALAAAQNAPKGLCGLILMATSGRPAGQLLVEQLRSNPANAPLTPAIEAIVADLEAGRHHDTVSMAPVLQPLFHAGIQPYLIDLFSYDPADVARSWQGPVLIIQGDEDIQVRSHDADLLKSALPQAERVDLPGSTHMLKAAVEGQPMATYTDPTIPLHADLAPAITRFLARSPPAE